MIGEKRLVLLDTLLAVLFILTVAALVPLVIWGLAAGPG